MWVDPSQDLADLIDDGRIEEAELLLRRILEHDPENSGTRALHALLLQDVGERDAALESARYATELDPHNAFAHWTMGVLLEERGRFADALRSATTSRDLHPGDPSGWTLLAQIHAREDRWEESLESAEAALGRDPSHEAAANLRALAIRHIESDERWEAELEALLERYPASGWVRAGQGWRALERGEAAEAKEPFEQAYALNPTSDYARSGLAESIKAQNRVYRFILRTMMWFRDQPPRVRWGIVFGGIIGYGYLRRAADAQPAFGIIAYPLMAAWVVFILSSWVAAPLSDFLLSLDERGKRLVRPDERFWGGAVATVLAGAALTGLAALVTSSNRVALTAMLIGFLVIPISAISQCSQGWPRKAMVAYTALPLLMVPLTAFGPPDEYSGWFVFGLLACVLGSWIGAFLASRVVRG